MKATTKASRRLAKAKVAAFVEMRAALQREWREKQAESGLCRCCYYRRPAGKSPSGEPYLTCAECRAKQRAKRKTGAS